MRLPGQENEVYFGSAEQELPDWREFDNPDDDAPDAPLQGQELQDFIAITGTDPNELWPSTKTEGPPNRLSKVLKDNYFAQPHDPIYVHLPDLSQGTSYSCGASCMEAICEYFGVGPEREIDFIQELGSNTVSGTNPNRILELARTLGLQVLARDNLTLDQLRQEVAAGRPVLALIQAYGGDKEEEMVSDENGHYVVVIGFDDHSIYVEDPMLKGARGVVPNQEFISRWHDEGMDGTPYTCWGASFWREERGEEVKQLQKDGGTCKPGERADLTGCAPADHSASSRSETEIESTPHKTLTKAKKLVDSFQQDVKKFASGTGPRGDVLREKTKHAQAVLGSLRGLSGKFYNKLEKRYGRKTAVSILAFGQSIGWGATAAGAFAGIPIWLPGSTVWGSLPAVALAELYLQVSKRVTKMDKGQELDKKEMEQLVKELSDELHQELERYLKEQNLVENKPVNRLKKAKGFCPQGAKVRIVSGEYAGKIGTYQSTIPMRYRNETETWRIVLDGFPKPGGWNGLVLVPATNVERV